MNESDEESLVRRAVSAFRDGDSGPVWEVLAEYRPTMLKTAERYLRSKRIADLSLADDIVQNATTSLAQHFTYDPDNGASFETWLNTCVRNAAVDELRRKSRKAAASLDEPRMETQGGKHPSHLDVLLDRSAITPANALLIDDECQRAGKVLDNFHKGLKGEQQQTLDALLTKEDKYRELKEKWNTNIGTVKSRLHTMRNKLDETLKRHDIPTEVAESAWEERIRSDKTRSLER